MTDYPVVMVTYGSSAVDGDPAADAELTWGPLYTAQQLGRFVAELRQARGLTQAELAVELGVTRQYLSEMERGVPTLYTDRLFALLRLLGGSLQGRIGP